MNNINTTKTPTTWENLRKEILSEKEREECRIWVELQSELIEARNAGLITQTQLEQLSGIPQPMISRIERGASIPTIETLNKLLLPLGKKLAVVNI